ncbi:MAG: leucine-rich repeat domain-containing protein [Acholeplasmataceae bacterium]|nr:leucine-rich repeat domain-containing protein [Acholeplasmataceae bacterium]
MASDSSIKKIQLSEIMIEDSTINKFVNLEKVSISKNVKILPIGAFHNKKKLKKVYIEPNSALNKIPDYCFSNCESLESFAIPKSIVSIGEKAFRGCKNINSIVIEKNLAFIDSSAFDGWTNEQIIYHHLSYKFTDKCKATLVDISEKEESKERVVTHETDLSIKKYIVTVKGGHVGRTHYIPLNFAISATSKKEAARRAREIPRVKHHHKDAILDVRAVTNEEYKKQIEINSKDPFLKVKSKRQQKEIKDIVDSRKIQETHNRKLRTKNNI